MRGIKVLMMLTLLLLSLTTTALAATRVAVMDFRDDTGENMASHIVGGIVDQLIQHPEFNVYERNRLKYILDEQGLQMTGLISDSQAVKIGKLAGVQYIITGEVTQATLDQSTTAVPYLGYINKDVARVAFHVSMIDVATGQLVNTESNFEGKKSSTRLGDNVANQESLLYGAANNAVEEFMSALKEKYPIIGKVVAVYKDNEIYINLGTRSGIKNKQKLQVYNEGRPIMSDGQVIGVRKTKVATLKVIDAQANMSICESDDFQNIKVGDRVLVETQQSRRR